MFIDWTKNLSETIDKVNFELKLHSSKPILDRLKELLDEREAALDLHDLSVKAFDSPNWAHKQAFGNGYRSCLKMMKTLIDLDKQVKRETK